MAQIFISWSSADADFVNPLAQRLIQEGFTVDEYSTDPTAGDIRKNVRRYVDNAVIALICLSANSIRAPWIHDEVAWCAYRYLGDGFPEMIPVLIGDVPTETRSGVASLENVNSASGGVLTRSWTQIVQTSKGRVRSGKMEHQS